MIDNKTIAFAGLKQSYDIELSKQLCPPRKSYLSCKHSKRIVIKIDYVLTEDPITGESYQPREEINVVVNVTELKTSLFRRGWIHSEEPLFVVKYKGNKKLYVLKSGFNRVKAMKELGYQYVIVDVYDDSDIAEDNILFKYVPNNDNLPSKPMKDIDYVKGAVEAIDTLGLKTDDEVISFLNKLTKTTDGIALRTPDEIAMYETIEVELDDGTIQSEDRLVKSCLLYKVRLKRGKQAHIRPYDGNGVNSKLKKLKRGFAGDKGILDGDTSELGYAFEKSNSLHRIWWDGMTKYRKYQAPIKLYGYVMNPSSLTLDSDRDETKEHYEDFVTKIKEKIYDSVDFESLQVHNIDEVPFKVEKIFGWGGFIPQDESLESGSIKEKDIIT